jgi:hypothetical protein
MKGLGAGTCLQLPNIDFGNLFSIRISISGFHLKK